MILVAVGMAANKKGLSMSSKIYLEFDSARILKSFLKALPNADAAEMALLLNNAVFKEKLTEDMISIWEETNAVEPSLISESYPDFFASGIIQ
jgi:hypothetical protein